MHIGSERLLPHYLADGRTGHWDILRHMGTDKQLTVDIKERALALGFDLVRVTTADPLPQAEAALKDRIRAGLMDGLDWFTEARAEVSANPRALLPGARSVLALGSFYLTDAPRDLSTPGDPHGRVSCYAWGDDYHEVIRKRLDALAEYV